MISTIAGALGCQLRCANPIPSASPNDLSGATGASCNDRSDKKAAVRAMWTRFEGSEN